MQNNRTLLSAIWTWNSSFKTAWGVYDVVDFKSIRFQSSTPIHQTRRIQKNLLWRAVSVCTWLGSYVRKADWYKKSMRFQKYSDLCGRSLKPRKNKMCVSYLRQALFVEWKLHGTTMLIKLNKGYLYFEVWLRFYRVIKCWEITWDQKRMRQPSLWRLM